MAPDHDQNLLKRVPIFQAVAILIGLIGFGIAKGKAGVLSFAVGATLATLSLWLIYRFVGALSGQQRPGALTFVLMATRLVLAGVILYAILRTYEVLLPAAACGVLTPVAAIILAAIYEHFYARTL